MYIRYNFINSKKYFSFSFQDFNGIDNGIENTENESDNLNKSDDDDEEAEADFEAYTSPRYNDILIVTLFYLFIYYFIHLFHC